MVKQPKLPIDPVSVETRAKPCTSDRAIDTNPALSSRPGRCFARGRATRPVVSLQPLTSLDGERKFALNELNVKAAVFDKVATISQTEKTENISLNGIARVGYGDSIGRPDGTGFADGTQAANRSFDDGFARFTQCNGESVRGDLRDRHREVDGESAQVRRHGCVAT